MAQLIIGIFLLYLKQFQYVRKQTLKICILSHV